MSVSQGLEWTFDTVASSYEKFRPGYTNELYKMIFDYIALNESCHAVEVGIGGGQATLPFLKTGCDLTAVEYGEEFSELCTEKFKEYSNFSVITSKFEDAAYYNKYHNKKQKALTEYSEEAMQRAKIAEKYGFVDMKYALFYRTRTFSAKEYIALLGTYSDHIAIEEGIRKKFFSKIEDAINNHGGTITVYDTIDLQLASKP